LSGPRTRIPQREQSVKDVISENGEMGCIFPFFLNMG
jgi:hypothetical protein